VASTTGSHSPPLSSRPASVTSNQYCIPPRRTAPRHRGPTVPLACRKHHPPNLSGFRQQHACHGLGHSEAGKLAAEVRAVHADAPAPCHLEAVVANGRPHLAAWLSSESLRQGVCRSITSPKGLLRHRAITNSLPIGGRTAWSWASAISRCAALKLLRAPPSPSQMLATGPCIAASLQIGEFKARHRRGSEAARTVFVAHKKLESARAGVVARWGLVQVTKSHSSESGSLSTRWRSANLVARLSAQTSNPEANDVPHPLSGSFEPIFWSGPAVVTHHVL
jgi:hypothetical protein